MLNLKLEFPPNRAVLKLPSVSLPRWVGNVPCCFELSNTHLQAWLRAPPCTVGQTGPGVIKAPMQSDPCQCQLRTSALETSAYSGNP